MIEKSCSLSGPDRAAVGSSIAMTEASRTSALLIITSHRSATDSSETFVSSGNLIPTFSAAAFAPPLERFQSISPNRVAFGAPSSMFCSALKCGTRLSS